MPRIHQRKYHPHVHKVKRLHHNEHKTINHLPAHLFDENLFDKTPKYIKYFDYPLEQLIADHSTDPLQNTCRQYTNKSVTMPIEGRFVNHEMIIRRNGETTILRPKQDLVLANGFTPVIRPSSTLPSYHSIRSDSQPGSSLSIINKMSTKKSESTSIIKTKRKNRYQRKRCQEKSTESNHLADYHFSNNYECNHAPGPNLVQLFKETLYNLIERENSRPPQLLPLMSVQPQFHSPPNQSYSSPLDDRRHVNNQPLFTPLRNNSYKEFFNDYPIAQYQSFEHSNLYREQICASSPKSYHGNYSHMSGYFCN